MVSLTPLLNNALNQVTGGLLGIGANTSGQSFSTIPVPNKRYALYTLSIRTPGQAKSLYASFTFPISPAAITKEYSALSAFYDTQGTPGQNGVARSVDSYGNTPPIFTIEGTTGWQYHATDGSALTGVQSAAKLQSFLNLYAQLNQAQQQANVPYLYTLEYYDYFANEYWQIEPFGRQGVSQNAQQPLLYRYQFRWAAVASLAAPIAQPVDLIQSAFQTAATQAGAALAQFGNNLVNGYGTQTAGAVMTIPANSALGVQLNTNPGAFTSGNLTFGPLFYMPGDSVVR